MILTIPSYLDKEFIVDDNQTLLRNHNNLAQFSRYKSGDNIPPNASVNDLKLIPLNTRVKITDAKMDASRNVFVFAVPIGAPDFIPSGWTRAGNLRDKFLNEIITYLPPKTRNRNPRSLICKCI